MLEPLGIESPSGIDVCLQDAVLSTTFMVYPYHSFAVALLAVWLLHVHAVLWPSKSPTPAEPFSDAVVFALRRGRTALSVLALWSALAFVLFGIISIPQVKLADGAHLALCATTGVGAQALWRGGGASCEEAPAGAGTRSLPSPGPGIHGNREHRASHEPLIADADSRLACNRRGAHP